MWDFLLCFCNPLDSGEWVWLKSSMKSTPWRVSVVQVEGLSTAEAALAFRPRSPLLAPGTQQRDVQSHERGDTTWWTYLGIYERNDLSQPRQRSFPPGSEHGWGWEWRSARGYWTALGNKFNRPGWRTYFRERLSLSVMQIPIPFKLFKQVVSNKINIL